MIYVYMGNSRQPAAIPKNFDFSNLHGSDLRMASKKRLLEDAKIVRNDQSVGVELGHFVEMGDSGQREFACQRYNKIEMIFYAVGMAESGDVPEMTVEGPCVMTSDLNRISTIWIPNMIAKQQKTTISELQLFDERPVFVKFQNVGHDWPTEWALQSIRMFSSERTTELAFGSDEVKRFSQNRIKFNW